MSNQVVQKGGSVCMVWKKKGESERYIGAIEPYTTVERLHELQAFNKRHADELRVLRMQEEYGMTVKRSSSVRKRETRKIDSKALTTSRTGHRMPKKSEETVHGTRHILPKPMIGDKSHTEVMAERRKDIVKKDTTTYNIKDLKRLQILETEINMRKPILRDKKTSQTLRRQTITDIAHHRSEINKITKDDHKSGLDIAKARKQGRIIVVDDEGNVY